MRSAWVLVAVLALMACATAAILVFIGHEPVNTLVDTFG